MAAHFTYKHLPASGMGQHQVHRSYATGGLGGAIPIVLYIDIILEWRIYEGVNRDILTTDRSLLVKSRNLIVVNRDRIVSERDRVRVARIFADIDRGLSRLDREAASLDRTYRSADRDLN